MRQSKTVSEEYWEQSVQPLYCLAFVVPLLLLYEVGVVWLGPLAMRNGADVWLRNFLAALGFGEYFFLPAVTCGFLLAWHHITRRTWKVNSQVLSGMICESFAIGVGVVVAGHVAGHFLHQSLSVDDGLAAMRLTDSVPHMLSYLGAGIYEELLFRLILLSGTIVFCQKIGADRTSSLAIAVIATSLLFAAAHYRLFFDVGLDFTWYSFLFRAGAGALFSVIYVQRGFGIVVGAHAVYDILVATVAG